MDNESINKLAYLEMLDPRHSQYDPLEMYKIDAVVIYKGSPYISMIDNNKGNLPGKTHAWSSIL